MDSQQNPAPQQTNQRVVPNSSSELSVTVNHQQNQISLCSETVAPNPIRSVSIASHYQTTMDLRRELKVANEEIEKWKACKKEKDREVFKLKTEIVELKTQVREGQEKCEKLVEFVRVANDEITKLIESVIRVEGGDGQGGEIQNQEESPPRLEGKMVPTFKKKMSALTELFKKLEERVRDLKSRMVDRNQKIVRFVEEMSKKRKTQKVNTLPSSSVAVVVGNEGGMEEVQDQENGGNVNHQVVEVEDDDYDENEVVYLEQRSDAANPNPVAETLMNLVSQPQPSSSRQLINEEEDDDVILIEPDTTPQPTTDADTQSQPENNAPPKIKVEPCGTFQPPRKRHTRDVTKLGLNIFYCTCGIRFASRAKLEPHIRFWKGGYQTFYKSTQGSDQSPLERQHRRARKLPRNLFSCDLCGNRFSRLCKVKVHKLQVHEIVDNQFQIGCRQCGLVLYSRSDFSKHCRIVHPWPRPSTTATSQVPQSSSSSARSRSAASKKKGQRHAADKTKSAILGYFCVCKARFLTQSDLRKHIRSFSGKTERWQCKTCGYSFKSRAGLKTHFRGGIHKSNVEKSKKARVTPYNCSCGKGFFHKQMLDKHYRFHFHRKIYKCSECRMKFSSDEKLGIHVRTVHS